MAELHLRVTSRRPGSKPSRSKQKACPSPPTCTNPPVTPTTFHHTSLPGPAAPRLASPRHAMPHLTSPYHAAYRRFAQAPSARCHNRAAPPPQRLRSASRAFVTCSTAFQAPSAPRPRSPVATSPSTRRAAEPRPLLHRPRSHPRHRHRHHSCATALLRPRWHPPQIAQPRIGVKRIGVIALRRLRHACLLHFEPLENFPALRYRSQKAYVPPPCAAPRRLQSSSGRRGCGEATVSLGCRDRGRNWTL